ncbi:hypothetical protein NDU88_005407, partial [Pleurodeles waltl]
PPAPQYLARRTGACDKCQLLPTRTLPQLQHCPHLVSSRTPVTRLKPCPVFRLSMGRRLKEPAPLRRATVTTQPSTAPTS